jgi:uncharacterized protein
MSRQPAAGSRTRATLVVLLLAVAALSARPRTAVAQDLPALTAPVNDLAHVIDPANAAELDRRIRVLQTTTGDAVVVATVNSYQPAASIEEYAARLYQSAGIGDKTKDNGVLIVVAVQDHAARIEVGYGLEEFITDGFAGETIRQAMLPAFREGRYGDGLLAGATRVIQRIADARGVTLGDVPREPEQSRGTSAPSFAVIIFWIIIALVIVNRIRRGGGPGSPLGRRRGPWSGWHGGLGGFGGGGFGGGFGGGGFGGGGGGFGGFGGGHSGGGGASGHW